MDNPIEIDLAHERSPSLSDDDESLFRNDNSQHANTQPNDNQDNDRYIERNSTPGLQQDMVDSSTSDEVEWNDPFRTSGPIEAGTNSAQAHMVPVRVSIISASNEFLFSINISVIVNLIFVV